MRATRFRRVALFAERPGGTGKKVKDREIDVAPWFCTGPCASKAANHWQATAPRRAPGAERFGIITTMSKIPVLVWMPAVFVIGGLVGYYGPSEELRSRELREQEEKAKPRSDNAFGSFAQMVKIPNAAKRPRRARDTDKQTAEGKSSTEASDSASGKASANEQTPQSERRHRRLAPEDLRARIDEAADLWRARVEIARTAASERLGLDGEKAQAFNDAVDAMNYKLRESMQLVADEIAATKAMTPELGVRLMGDLSTSLAETYDAIGACVGENLREEVSNIQLVDFVDPSVAEPLIAVQDKIDPQSFRGPR